MKFVHPEILWALGALAIPIIVHLFNFRKFKKVLFSNVEFLKEIKQETQSKSKIKHWLILLARLLAITCIVFAFAQPFIPSPGASMKPGGTAVSIYIDNSFSMESEGAEGRLLELAKNKAIEIVNAYQPTDKFQLLTSDFEGRHQRLVSKEEMTDLIQEVDISPVSRKLSEVVSRQKDLLKNSGLENKRSFVLTDLQASVTDLDQLQNDSTIQVNLVPDIAEDVSNVFIDSVWFDSPVRQLNQPEVLNAHIVNTGDEPRENVPVQLIVNGQQKSVASVNMDADGSADLKITYTNTEPGYKNCILNLDDNSITKDDDFYFSYNVASQIAVLEIRGDIGSIDAVPAVFSGDPYFAYTASSESNIDFGSFTKQNLIILNQVKGIPSGLAAELEKFVTSGGSVLVIPASEIVINEYNLLLARLSLGQISGKKMEQSKVNTVNYEHFIFKNAFEKTTGNVDLPGVSSFYEISLASRSSAEPMMSLQTGAPFMVSSIAGAGRAYLTAVSLATEESNFINHAFFPATLLRTAEFSQPASQLYYFLGKEQGITLRNLNMPGEETFKMRNEQTAQELIPEHRNAGGNTEIYVHTDLQVAGNYSLAWGASQVASLSFDYDRAESVTKALTTDAVNAAISEKGWSNWNVLNGSLESIAASANEQSEGKRYWLSMIVWALILLAIEILLIKFWR